MPGQWRCIEQGSEEPFWCQWITILLKYAFDSDLEAYLRVTKQKCDIAADFWMSSCAAGNVSLRICCHCLLETRGVEVGGLVWLSLMLLYTKVFLLSVRVTWFRWWRHNHLLILNEAPRPDVREIFQQAKVWQSKFMDSPVKYSRHCKHFCWRLNCWTLTKLSDNTFWMNLHSAVWEK